VKVPSILFCFVLAARTAHAEPTEQTLAVSLDAHLGRSTAPYSTPAFPRTSGYGASLVLGARFELASRFELGLRVPLVLMRVEQPAGALYAEAAWGNLELNVSLQRTWIERPDWRSFLGASLAVGVPTAEHDPAQLAGRALRLADAFEGFSEPALYTPGMVPLTTTGSLTLQSLPFRLVAALSLPLLVRVSDADLPPESQTRPLGFVPVFRVEAKWRVARWLSLAATPRVAVLAIAPVEDHGSVVQLLAAGQAEFQIAPRFRVATLFQAPLAGSLAGSTLAGGLRLEGSF